MFFRIAYKTPPLYRAVIRFIQCRRSTLKSAVILICVFPHPEHCFLHVSMCRTLNVLSTKGPCSRNCSSNLRGTDRSTPSRRHEVPHGHTRVPLARHGVTSMFDSAQLYVAQERRLADAAHAAKEHVAFAIIGVVPERRTRHFGRRGIRLGIGRRTVAVGAADERPWRRAAEPPGATVLECVEQKIYNRAAAAEEASQVPPHDLPVRIPVA